MRVASLLGVRGTPTTRSTAAARRQLLPAAIAATPPLKARAISHSVAVARRREAEVEARTCVSDLARYIEFLREEEECLVEHAKSLTVIVAATHDDAEAP